MQNLATLLTKQAKQILVFDFDETIARIVIDWTAWHTGVADIISQFDPTHICSPGREHLSVNEAVRRFGKSLRDQLWAFNEAYEVANALGIEINEPLVEFNKTDQKYRKFLYTSNSKIVAARYLAELGIETCFERFCFRDDVALVKPDPDGFWRVLHDTSVPLSRYLMIGDSSSDEGMAKTVGLDFSRSKCRQLFVSQCLNGGEL